MEKAEENLELIFKYFSNFSAQQTAQFRALGGLYKEWNSKINVISRKDIDSLYLKHVLHSLSIAAIANFKPGTTIIDIGTGGGFPGIPLAIYFPEVQFHLVDSINKKLTVVKEIAAAIELKNITTQHTRVEAIKTQKFDFVVSRAVTALKELWQWSAPLLNTNQKNELQTGLICLKGGDLSEEISQSNVKPQLIHLSSIFKEDFFENKSLLYIKK